MQCGELRRAEPVQTVTSHDMLAGVMELKLIAHRGGVVSDPAEENTIGALEAAIDAGYWMIETDPRLIADGTLVVHHDQDLQRKYGRPERIADLDYETLISLTGHGDSGPPLTFAQLCERCAGRIRIMLDFKERDPAAGVLDEVQQTLAEHGLLADCYCIGSAAAKEHFAGTCRIARRPPDFQIHPSSAEERMTFLFGHGYRQLTPEIVAAALAAGRTVVPSVNLQHYPHHPMAGGRSDLAWLREAGVTEFQIDSVYDRFLLH